ncbi:MAG TPA: glycosyltransferase family A protein [Longimicrobiales bacterium]|nr:glycosyltransferase family A protein [Longimicrobiales bacterium]
MPALAIVIPAYKPTFLRAALDSIAAQTDRRLRVYVGDDAGPPEVGEICAAYAADGLDLVYRRYEHNLGGSSLTAHWNRCVRLSSEPWVWLFADDDVMEPECVTCFHRSAEVGTHDLLRFDTTVIGARGQVLAENPPHPRHESGVDFIHARLLGERNSYVVEYVFSREAFDRAGGFPEYPVAWCADDAAWFLFSRGGHIHTLGGAKVQWRASGLNITDAKRKHQREKLAAASQFLRVVDEEVRPRDESVRTVADWRDAAERWYLGQIRYLMPIGPALWGDVLRGSGGIWRAGTVSKLATLSLGSASAALRMLRTGATRKLGTALGLSDG